MIVLAAAWPAWTQESVGRQTRRHALLIGNQSYKAVSALDNPINDAQSLRTVLEPLGFEVRIQTDLGADALRSIVEDWATSLTPDSLALFYYAGHGVQIDGENYLIPIDFEERSEARAKTKAVRADWVRERMESSPALLRLIILDACRNNPFRSRGGDNSLAGMITAAGTFIALSTGPGMQASDGGNRRNGLFTSYLVDGLKTNGVELMDLFSQVRERVVQETDWRQVPRVDSGVVGKFYFRPPPGWVDPRSRKQQLVDTEQVRRRAETRDRQMKVARARLKAGDNAGALTELLKAAEVDPENLDVLGLLAQVQVNQGMWEAAARSAGKAITLAPKSVALLRLRGYALFEASRYQEAIDDLTRALQIAPDARTYWLRSSARIRIGDLAGAEADRKAQRALSQNR